MRFVAKCFLAQGWIKAGRRSPEPGFIVVNAPDEFGISPPKCAGATGFSRSRRQVGPGMAESAEK